MRQQCIERGFYAMGRGGRAMGCLPVGSTWFVNRSTPGGVEKVTARSVV